MITQPATPVLIDAFIVEFNEKIIELLPWLNNPLGKIQTISKEVNGSIQKVPAMHQSTGEYLEVFPSDKLTNYSWWDVSDLPYGGSRRVKTKITQSAALNFFVDLHKIYPGVTASRDLENVKLEVLNALASITLLSGSIQVDYVYEDYYSVYSGYSLSTVADNYFMQPYAGLRFELKLVVRNLAALCPQ